MSIQRKVKYWEKAVPTLEGAGVRLNRAFGPSQVPGYDPFLLLDDIKSENPADFIAGFPWHPHRGIETVTYVIDGVIEHGDSIGNKGEIGPGDVQWMTAGNGIIHQEMPKGGPRGMWGLQLWVNLPRESKMVDPTYRGVRSGDIPVVETEEGALVRVIAGSVSGVKGPVSDIVRAPRYIDVELGDGGRFVLQTPPAHNVFLYMLEGEVENLGEERVYSQATVLRFGRGDYIEVNAVDGPARFLLGDGEPLGEPVAWRGPIVMNTDDELNSAFDELDKGTFLSHKRQL